MVPKPARKAESAPEGLLSNPEYTCTPTPAPPHPDRQQQLQAGAPGAIQDRFKTDFIVKLEVRFPIFFTYSACVGDLVGLRPPRDPRVGPKGFLAQEIAMFNIKHRGFYYRNDYYYY